MSSINRKIKRSKIKPIDEYKGQLIQVGWNGLATKYITKYVDKNFSPIFWSEQTYGNTDYSEMPKLILHLMKKKLVHFFPIAMENEHCMQSYTNMEQTLSHIPNEKINKEYIETFKINLDEMEKDIFEIFATHFRITLDESKERK